MSRSRISRTVLLLLGPALFLLFYMISLQVQEPNMLRVLGVAAWMVSWWVTEAVPIPATSLLPIILFPAIGIFNISSAAAPYSDPVIFLFMGGFIIALAMEHNQLHKRIALKLINLTGTKPNGIILGFYLATFILSMWISNTATAVMMLPVALSIIQLMKTQNPFLMEEKGFKNFCLSLLLGIAYAANIGGVMTIIGTPPNVVMVGMMRQFLQIEMGFNQWLLIGIPLGVTMLALMFFLMNYLLFPNRMKNLTGSGEMINKQLMELGPMRKAEKRVSLIVVLTAAAWIFRGLINQQLGITFLNDTNIALIGGMLMFMVPADKEGAQKLITWKQMDKLPWGILLLFGGGLSLAKAMEASGIVEQVGILVSNFDQLHLWVLIAGLTFMSLFMTELMSNVALTTLFIPIVIGISSGLNIPAHLLVIPVTLSASFAFMLPIATPPNAIVFSSGFIKMKDMIQAGIILNLISVLIICLLTYTLVNWVYL
ncbi:SLC13 family permease [Litoribacter populi]|uniref:SLC13 family permease n=1 Tax=Litoribacter populi TaxID=2598460 RepID=UPI00117BF65C|nr:DASS family sodium-coupled anion symporter [Litoribacter populi]